MAICLARSLNTLTQRRWPSSSSTPIRWCPPKHRSACTRPCAIRCWAVANACDRCLCTPVA
ncbi:hypothetical protein C7E18_20800, partial [Stenotrophomonas maltophilia]